MLEEEEAIEVTLHIHGYRTKLSPFKKISVANKIYNFRVRGEAGLRIERRVKVDDGPVGLF